MALRSGNSQGLYRALRVAPLLVFPLALFALCVIATQGGSWADAVAFTPHMVSGADWAISYGDLFLSASLLVLFVEIVKAVHTEASDILNHGLSMMVAIACVVLFATVASFTNSTFFILMMMTFIDVIAGFVITIVAARRDFGVQTSH